MRADLKVETMAQMRAALKVEMRAVMSAESRAGKLAALKE